MGFHDREFRDAYAKALPGRDPYADVRATTAMFVKHGMPHHEAEAQARRMAAAAVNAGARPAVQTATGLGTALKDRTAKTQSADERARERAAVAQVALMAANVAARTSMATAVRVELDAMSPPPQGGGE